MLTVSGESCQVGHLFPPLPLRSLGPLTLRTTSHMERVEHGPLESMFLHVRSTESIPFKSQIKGYLLTG